MMARKALKNKKNVLYKTADILFYGGLDVSVWPNPLTTTLFEGRLQHLVSSLGNV